MPATKYPKIQKRDVDETHVAPNELRLDFLVINKGNILYLHNAFHRFFTYTISFPNSISGYLINISFISLEIPNCGLLFLFLISSVSCLFLGSKLYIALHAHWTRPSHGINRSDTIWNSLGNGFLKLLEGGGERQEEKESTETITEVEWYIHDGSWRTPVLYNSFSGEKQPFSRRRCPGNSRATAIPFYWWTETLSVQFPLRVEGRRKEFKDFWKMWVASRGKPSIWLVHLEYLLQRGGISCQI